MNEEFIKDIDRCCKTLALDFSGVEQDIFPLKTHT